MFFMISTLLKRSNTTTWTETRCKTTPSRGSCRRSSILWISRCSEKILQDSTAKRGDDNILTMLTTILDRPRPPPPLQVGGGEERTPFRDVQVVKTGQNCYFLDEEEKCVCPPHRIKVKDMTKQTKQKLKRLAEKKQITCSKPVA